MIQKYKKLLISILAILLSINIFAIGVLVLHNYNDSNKKNKIEIPNNIIDGEIEKEEEDIVDTEENLPVYKDEDEKEANVITINKHSKSENNSFNLSNMLPGDIKTEYYCIQVSYVDTVLLKYSANIKEELGDLSNVLTIKVKLMNTNEVLYNGTLKDIPKTINYSITSNKNTTDELYYEITISLDKSVGNEYQDKKILIDFKWEVDSDNLENPYTSDNILLWIVLSASSGLIIILILLIFKRERKDENE